MPPSVLTVPDERGAGEAGVSARGLRQTMGASAGPHQDQSERHAGAQLVPR